MQKCEIKMPPKIFFSSTAKLKCCRIKFFDQKAKLKCREEKTHLWKKNASKMYFLCFAFLSCSWNSDNEYDIIFEPERCFSGVFNTFENIFKFAFRLLLLPKFLKCTHITKINFQHSNAKLKCRKYSILVIP